MRTSTLFLAACAMVCTLWAAPVDAQEGAPEPVEPEPEASIEYGEPKLSRDEYRRQELEQGVKRSRNALIGLSAATVVGFPLWIAGARTQCVAFDDGSGSTQTSCSTGGKVMVGLGVPLAVGGVTGVLISGIILGVRKGKLRDVEARTGYSSSKKLRWDPYSAQFVF